MKNAVNWIEIVASDGYPLSAATFEPDGQQQGSVIIVPAMGISQEFYHPFAVWLCAQGFRVTTFDYRGSGRSRRGSLRRLRADLGDWAKKDAAAALAQVVEHHQAGRLIWVGHSLGGQILPFVTGWQAVNDVITVASGSGYWRENTPSLRRKVWFLWFFLVPLSLPLFGYFPGKRIGMIGDIPRGVMRQWRRWCLHPEYAAGVEKAQSLYSDVKLPITALSFTDDEFMSARNIEALHASYRNANRSMIRMDPTEWDLKRIGHFGFFRSAIGVRLWERVISPVLSATAD